MARAESDLKREAEASSCKLHVILGKRGVSLKCDGWMPSDSCE